MIQCVTYKVFSASSAVCYHMRLFLSHSSVVFIFDQLILSVQYWNTVLLSDVKIEVTYFFFYIFMCAV